MNERSTWRGQHPVLVDSSAYFALAEPRDAHHGEARTILSHLTAERWRLVTTNFVVAEAHALLLTRLGRRMAATFLEEIAQSRGTTTVRVALSDEQQARGIIARYDDKDFSLTDAISFAVMERLGIAFAFAFDQHFAQYGVRILTPAHW